MAALLCSCVQHSNRAVASAYAETHHASSALPEDQIEFTYRVEGQNGILDSDKVMLVAADLPKGERESFALNGNKLTLWIGGSGSADVSISHRMNTATSTLGSHYADGTNTVQFCGREFKLANKAKTLIVGKDVFDLSAGKKTVQLPSNNP